MRFILLLPVLVALIACTESPEHGEVADNSNQKLAPQCELPDLSKLNPIPQTTEWDKKRWIAKVSRYLKAGTEISHQRIHELSNLEHLEIIDQLMQEGEFQEFMLDFNMYFIGFKIDNFRESFFGSSQNYNEFVYGLPHAIQSARETFIGKNFESLFDLYQPDYISPLISPSNPPEMPSGKPGEVRTYYFNKIIDHV